MDLDQGGRGFQKVRAYLGPSLGWTEEQLLPETDITATGTYTVKAGDGFLLVDVAGAVNVQLPDVREWVKQTANQPATGFGRAITVKDLGGNASNFPITVIPFGTQEIDALAQSVSLTVSRATMTFVPLIDLSGWCVQASFVGAVPPGGGDVFKAGNNTFTGDNFFTGTLAAPTMPPESDSQNVATTAFVKSQNYVNDIQLAAYAPKESPALTGTPTAPTPGNAVNDNTIATTAFVKSNLATYQPLDDDLTAISALTGAGIIYYRSGIGTWTPVVIGANMSFAGGVLSSTGGGGTGDVTAAGNNTFTGVNVFNGSTDAVTVTASDNSTKVATTAYVKSQGYLTSISLVPYATLANPIFTGDPQAPTPLLTDSDTSIATTAYVKGNLSNFQPLDADLTALAALTGVNTIYYRSAPDTWSPVTIGGNMTFAGGVLDSVIAGGTVNSAGGGYSTTVLTGYADATGNVIRAITPGTGMSIVGTTLTLDGDLVSLAGASSTNAMFYRSAASTWSPVTIGSGLTFSGGTLTASATGGGNVSNSGTPIVGQYARWVNGITIEGVAPATVRTDIGAQPLDADLTAIAALTGTNTIYYRSAADTWSAVTIGANLTFSGGTLAGTAGGNVSNVGTPVDDQIAVWTATTTIEGSAKFTWSNASNTLTVTNGTDGVALVGAAGAGHIKAAGSASVGLAYTTKGENSHTFYIADFARVAFQMSAAGGSNTFLVATAAPGGVSLTTNPASAPITIENANLTGDPKAPTPTAGDNDTSVATTAFVQAAIAAGGGFTTGDAKLTLKTVADAGWIMMNDQLIGSAASGANYANNNAQALFMLLFQNITDTWCPIFTSTGAATTRAAQGTAAAAWAANCRIVLPRQLGRSLVGAGAGAGLSPRPLGATFGAETHAQVLAEMTSHYHTLPGQMILNFDGSLFGITGGANAYIPMNYNFNVGYAAGASGSGSPMDIMNPSACWNIMIKL